MRATFLLGPAGSGKTWQCLAEIRAELQRAPEGPPLLLIAPKQATFQLERQLLAGPELPGYTRLQILSFERLARGILEHFHCAPLALLDDEGRLMVLRAILARHHRDLRLFRATARLPGFARQLSVTLRELQERGVTPGGLAAQAERARNDPVLAAKLRDLGVLFRAYQDWLAEHALQDSHRLLDLATGALREALGTSPGFKLDGLWLDGFAEMTPQELDLLAAVIPTARHALLAFCLRRIPDREELRLSAWNLVGQTCQQLQARLEGRTDVELRSAFLPRPDQPTRFSANPCLAELEQAWDNPGAAPNRVEPRDSLRLVACPDLETETVVAAREIRQQVRAGGRYRDCAILLRSFEGYHEILARTLRRYEIPFFLDRREPVAHHPLAELTRYALRLAAFGWQSEDWLGVLKTGLAPLEEEAVDELENAALAHGWRGGQWRKPLEIPDDPALARRLEPWRARAVPPFACFADELAAGKTPSGAQLADALGALWRELEVNRTLEAWARADPGDSRPPMVRRAVHETVGNQWETWRDNLALAFPDTALPLAEWLPIVEAGLATLTVGIIPPALDQVLVGTIDRSRNPELQLVLLLGMNEGRFPAAPAIDGLLTDAEREHLQAHGLALAPDPLSQIGRERYLGYIACTRAARRLVLTFAERDLEGRVLNPSPFVAHLQRCFPALTATPAPDPARTEPLHPCEFLSPLLNTLGQDAATAEAWIELPAFAAHRNQLRRLAAYAPESALPAGLAQALHGPVLRTSVSALERFAACPFQFFVRTGLRAEERPEFEVDSRERGTFQHEVLARFHHELEAEGQTWRDLTPGGARERATRIATALLDTHRNGLFAADATRRFAARQLAEALADYLEIAVGWMRTYGFNPRFVELGFGRSADPLPAWELDLGDGRQLAFRGQIDRVDLVPDPDDATVARCVVVDYKSSARRIDPVLLENGLQLQLPAYLAALRALPIERLVPGTRRLAPAGVFYVNLRGTPAGGANRREVLSALGESRRAAYQHRGRFRSDQLPHLDRGFPGENSGQFSWRMTQSGLSRRPGDAMAPEAFEAMLGGVAEILRGLGRRIYRGETGVEPYEHKGRTACQNCDFQGICRIDPWTHSYRTLGAAGAAPPDPS